jgi:hypothetical protein
MTENISIPYNKALIGFFSALWLLCAAVGLPVWIWMTRTGALRGWIPLVWMIFFFCIFLYYLVSQLILPMLRGKPALELTPDGLRDNLKDIFITWDNISGFALVVVGRGSSYIRVDMEDEQAFMNQIENPVRAWLSRRRWHMAGSPFVIPTALLEGSNHTILSTLEGYREHITPSNNAS